MGKSLVLNATYQPLCVVAARRAVVLVLKEKATVVEVNGQAFRSEHLKLRVPSVVCLNYFVQIPHRAKATLSRRGVFVRDGNVCQYCGATAENVDHVVPRSRGGTHVWENVVAACRPCNAKKENRLVDEAGLRLRRAPAAPKDSLFVIAGAGIIDPSWEPYLGAPYDAYRALIH